MDNLLCDVDKLLGNVDKILVNSRTESDEDGISALSATTGPVLIPKSIVTEQLEKLSFEYIRQLQNHLDCLVFTSERNTK